MTLEFMPEDNTIIQVPLPSTIIIHFVICQYSSLTYKHILMSFSDFKRNENYKVKKIVSRYPKVEI